MTIMHAGLLSNKGICRVVNHGVVDGCAIARGPDYLSNMLLRNHSSGTVAMATLLWEYEADFDPALIGWFISNHLAGDLQVTVGEICEKKKL